MESTPTYAPATSLDSYISCKRISAAKIAFIEDSPNDTAVLLLLENGGRVAMSREWMRNRGAQPGGYFIVYEDGYASWSPAEVFEAGCVRADAWGLSRGQTQQHNISLRGRIFNRKSGEEIPANVPVFVIDGRDNHAIATIGYYRSLLPDDQRSKVDPALLNFSTFALVCPDLMREPRLPDPVPPAPFSLNDRGTTNRSQG